MPSTRTFENIINLAVGNNTAGAAVDRIIVQLKALQGIALETGMVLDTNILSKMAGQGGQASALSRTTFTGPGLSQATPYTYGQTTMGGMAAQGSGGAGGMYAGLTGDIGDEARVVAAERQLEKIKRANETALTAEEDFRTKTVSMRRGVVSQIPEKGTATLDKEEQLRNLGYLSESDLQQMRAAQQSGESAFAQNVASRQRYTARMKEVGAEAAEVQRVQAIGEKEYAGYGTQGDKFTAQRIAAQEADFRQAQAIGEKAYAGYEKQGEKFTLQRATAQEADFQRNLKLGVSAMDEYDKQGNKFLMQQSKIQDETGKSGRSFAGHVQSIITGMLVWQGMNTVMNAIIGTYQTAVDETMRLDQASARLSVTLGTTKEAASQTAMAMSLQGIQYGLAPEQTLKAGQWAARMEKTPETRQEIQKVSQTLAAISPEGEDIVKIMQALHGANIQTGLSFTELGDRAAIMTQKANVSITEYLSNLAQLGPLAKQNGVELEKLGIIAAMTADRTGESMSQVTNTMTRLMRAAQAPNQEQLSVMRKYDIKVGDYDAMMDIIAKSKMTSEEIGQMSGMPGKPEVIQQILALVETYKTYNDTMKQGMDMQEQLAKSTDNLGDANKRLGASWNVLWQSIGAIPAQAIGGIAALDTLTRGVTGLSKAAQDFSPGQAFVAFFAMMGGLAHPELQKMLTDMEKQQKAMTGGLPPDMRGEQAGTGAISGITPKQTMTAMQLMLAQSAEKETGPVDMSKYTAAQIEGAKSRSQRMTDDWIKAQEELYDSLKIPADEKEKAIQKVKEMADSAVVFIEDITGNITAVTGAQALHLQDALAEQEKYTSKLKVGGPDWSKYSDEEIKRAASAVPQYQKMQEQSWRQELKAQGVPEEKIGEIIAARIAEVLKMVLPVTRGAGMAVLTGPMAAFMPETLQASSRTQVLEDRLSELRRSLEDLDDTEKKRAQLEGQWNIPTGAKLLVPLTAESQALIKEHGGESEDEARNRRREQILREIAETERKLAAEKAKDAALLIMLSGQQNASATANTGLSSAGAAGHAAKAGLDAAGAAGYALKAAMGDWGKAPAAGEQARERGAGAIPEPNRTGEDYWQRHPPETTPPTGTYQPGMQGQTMNLNSVITLKAIPINIVTTSMITMDGVAVAQALQKYLTQDLIYEATSSGALSQ